MTLKKGLKKESNQHHSERSAWFSKGIPSVVRKLISLRTGGEFDRVGPVSIPSHRSVVRIIEQTRSILFPGFFILPRPSVTNLEQCLEEEVNGLFETLSEQIVLSMQHDCLQFQKPCHDCRERSRELAQAFIISLPEIRALLAKDIVAALEGDPAAKSYDEVVFSYPGLFAITVYRLAHNLYELSVPIIPRIMTEYAHSLTGIDIHPGAKIGESFFIDHGTGVVVGETTEIGNRVRLYQGVTLGALSLPRDAGDRFRNKKRHPTIEDDVIIYANATLLGKEAVIGARSVIGGNVWIIDRVPPDTRVLLKPPKLAYIGNHTSKAAPRKD